MKHDVTVSLYYSGAWHDVTTDDHVLASTTISTSRLAATQLAKPDPGATKVELDNTNGRYTPVNPMSPLYGLLTRCMPLAVDVDGRPAWTGEAWDWTPQRQLGGRRSVVITGSGVIRRLGTGVGPITSALVSTILAMSPTVYLPLVDGPIATHAGSPLAGKPATDVDGMRFGAIDGPAGDTRSLPQMVRDGIGGTPAWTVPVLSPTGTDVTIDLIARGQRKDGFSYWPLLYWRTAPDTPDEVVWSLDVSWTSPDTTDSIAVFGYEVHGTNFVFAECDTGIVLDDAWHHLRVVVSHSGGTTTAELIVDDDASDTDAATLPPGDVTELQLVSVSSTTLVSGSIGHVALYPSASPGDSYPALSGLAGELAADRFARVAAAAGLPYTIVGTPADDSRPIGPHPTARVIDVLYDCAVTDGGMMYEGADGSLTLRCLGAMYRQTAVLVVDVDTDIVPPLDAVISTSAARNDVTAKRTAGSSARYELTSGQLGTADPPDGIGPADTTLEVNPADESTLIHYASWLCAVTCDPGVRYPTVTLDLDASPGLDLDDVEIGAVIQLDGIPPYDDPETPRLLITGITDTSGTHRRTIALRTAPARPYDVGLCDDAGWLDCGACTTTEDLDTTETGIDVACADACAWTHADGDYSIVIGGEEMTVTAVTAPAGAPGAWTQTLTVTRAMNGVVKTHGSGAEVHVLDPFLLAL
jgi:hypothetical protein